MADDVKEGLEGVYIGDSLLGKVDGKQGVLYYNGYSIDELVPNASYEEVVYLLWHQELPPADALQGVTELMAGNRDLPQPVIDAVTAMGDTPPMDALRTGVSMLAMADDDPNDQDAVYTKAVDIIAKVPTIIAYHYHARNGTDPVPPRNDLSHAANFLYMLHGKEPTEKEAAAMNAALILYAEHGMNASTFAGVVTTSTLANVYSAVTAAIGALQGPLHGGATETVMDMLDGVGGADKADDWVQEKLESHEKIPGFGHRVYRVTDPRCAHFKHHIEELAGTTYDRLQTIEAVRAAVEERLGDKHIWPNADLYSGTMYQLLDIPPAYYTTLFAMARVAGWTAHINEQLEHNRIIRPRVEYVGELDKAYVPVDER